MGSPQDSDAWALLALKDANNMHHRDAVGMSPSRQTSTGCAIIYEIFQLFMRYFINLKISEILKEEGMQLFTMVSNPVDPMIPLSKSFYLLSSFELPGKKTTTAMFCQCINCELRHEKILVVRI